MTPPIGTVISPTGQMIVSAIPLRVTIHPSVAAQRAGDAAYEAVLEHGGDGQEAAVAYHTTVQRIFRETGIGGHCDCSLCQTDDPQPGVESPDNHAADLKGW